MAKKPTTRQRPTHFEQVPLSAVKTTGHGSTATAPTKKTIGGATGGRANAPASHYHAVQFYDSPDSLCRIVGSFIGEGLLEGAAAVLLVTPDNARRIETCLRQYAIDVDALKRDGILVIADARDTLGQFMVDGTPNPVAFRRTVGGLLTEMRRRNADRPIRAYGEMVDLLWKDGRETSAIRLETLWNQLAGSYAFELLCGYSMGNFYKGSALEDIKRQHSHVVPAEGRRQDAATHALPR